MLDLPFLFPFVYLCLGGASNIEALIYLFNLFRLIDSYIPVDDGFMRNLEILIGLSSPVKN